jgi:hypothetical protein
MVFLALAEPLACVGILQRERVLCDSGAEAAFLAHDS